MFKSLHLYDWFVIAIVILVATNSYTGYLLYHSKSDTKDLHHDCLLKTANLEKREAVHRYIDSVQQANINNLKEQLKLSAAGKNKTIIKYVSKNEKNNSFFKNTPLIDSTVVKYNAHIDSLLSECRQHPLPGDFEILN